MQHALAEANRAAEQGEVPVGAIVVVQGQIVGRGHNRRESLQDPMGHAELVAISEACKLLNTWRLPKSTLYVTLEPCPMCAGAILQARIERVVFGCRDRKAGAVRSLFALLEDPRLNHRVDVIEGILEEDCSLLLSDFFKKIRSS